MRLKNVGLRFRGRYKVLGGQHFRGQILDLPDTSRVSNFLSARRYLRVHPKTSIVSGIVVVIDSVKYIVADHGTGFLRDPIYTHFKLFQVDQEAEWFTKAESTNTVTGVKEKGVKVSQGTIYISVQPKGSISDSLKIQTPRHVLVTNAALQVDDLIGDNWIVVKSDLVLGIYVVEVKEG